MPTGRADAIAAPKQADIVHLHALGMFAQYLVYDKSPVFFRDRRIGSAIQAVRVMMSQNYEHVYCRLLNITPAFVPLWKQRSN
jgi:hypothetical protein